MFKGNNSTGKTKFSPCPTGPQQLVCIDIVDLGMQPTDYGDKPKVRFVFYSAAIDNATGKPYRVSSQMTNSLHEKSSMRKFIDGWIGRSLTADEVANGFGEELLLGRNAFVSIVHTAPKADGTVYANINSIMPLPAAYPALTIPSDFVRDKDKKKDDSDIPF